MRFSPYILLLLLLINKYSISQDAGSQINSKSIVSFLNETDTRISKIRDKLDKNTSALIAKALKQEMKVRKKLGKIDSLTSASLFADVQQRYFELENRLKEAVPTKRYNPSLDTLSTALRYLGETPGLSLSANGTRIGEMIDKVDGINTGFGRADLVQQFIIERKNSLLAQLPGPRFTKQLKLLNKQVFYYNQQLEEFRSLLKDRKNLEKKILALLTGTQMFQKFFSKNSLLAALFPRPEDTGTMLSSIGLPGLQTRTQVNNLIQQQFAAFNNASQQEKFQNLAQAHQQFLSLRDSRTATTSGSSNDNILPEGFRTNNQRTKSFLKRLVVGTNIQSQKASSLFPVTSDLGLSLGYKLNDRSLVGIGASYKIGWGESIRHIRFSSQGIGIRSFVDWKIKGSFWVTGGYEHNYHRGFRRIDDLKHHDAWQQSGLIGISKTMPINAKLLKQTKVQLLWDFLSYKQQPASKPLVFRVGYSFSK